MESSLRRLASFQTWPSNVPVRPEQLVEAGFYYSNHGDEVTCFSCRYTLSQWEEGDVPLFEHYKHSPHCTFVLQQENLEELKTNMGAECFDAAMIKPPDHVGVTTADSVQIKPPDYQAVRVTTDAVQVKPPDEQGYQMLVQDTANLQFQRGKTQLEYCKKDARLDTFKTWRQQSPDPLTLVDAGFFYTGIGDTVCCYQCGVKVENWEKGDDPVALHKQRFKDCKFFCQPETAQRQGEEEGLRTRDMGPRLDVRRDVAEDSESVGKSQLGLVVREDKEEELRSDPKGCSQCKKKSRDTMFLPCEHFVCCEACARSWLKCSKCGFPVTGYITFP